MVGYKNKPKTVLAKRKRSYPSRVFSRSLRKSIPLGKSDYGFPDRFVTKLRYVEQGSFDYTGGTSQANTFRLNSVYDPNLSGIGHQPMYHDTLSTIYAKYRVLGAKATVTFAMQSPPSLAGGTANFSPTGVGLICSNSSSFVATSLEQRMEENDNDCKILGDKGSGSSVVKCRATFNPSRDLGNGVIDDSNASNFGNNPAQVYYMHIFKQEASTNPSTTVNWFVTIEYRVEVFQRLEAQLS